MDESQREQHEYLVAKVAAVGRGVAIRSKDKEAAPLIREIAQLIQAVKQSPRFAPAQKAPALAKTFSKRFGVTITAQQIESALNRDKWNGTVADIVDALALFGERSDEVGMSRSDKLKAVAGALMTEAEHREKDAERVAKGTRKPKKK